MESGQCCITINEWGSVIYDRDKTVYAEKRAFDLFIIIELIKKVAKAQEMKIKTTNLNSCWRIQTDKKGKKLLLEIIKSCINCYAYYDVEGLKKLGLNESDAQKIA